MPQPPAPVLEERVCAEVVSAGQPLSAEEIALRLGGHSGVKAADLADAVLAALYRLDGAARVSRRRVLVHDGQGDAAGYRLVWGVRPTSASEAPPPVPEPTPAPRRSVLDFFKPKGVEPPPARPAPGDLVADLTDACVAADLAAAGLARALQRRHRALVALSSAFPAGTSAKAGVNRQIVSSTIHRALCAHGLGELLGLPAVAHQHRSFFRDQARAIPAAPAAPGSMETHDAETVS